MRSHSSNPLSLLLACALLAGSAGVGAEPAPAVKEVGPEIFYLRDDGGRLVPVPGFGYRDFVDLLRLKDGLPGVPQPPAAVLERIEVAGDLVPNGTGVCELTITLRLRQTRAGWARVPLALSGVALTAPPEHEGEGRLILDADSATPGYEAWLEAAVDSVHTVTLVGIVGSRARQEQPTEVPVVEPKPTDQIMPELVLTPPPPLPAVEPIDAGVPEPRVERPTPPRVVKRPPPKRPKTGRVTVRVNPWAEVFLANRKLGVTPFDPVEVPAGAATFTLKNAQLGVTRRVTVKVPAGGNVVLRADLSK